MHKPTKRQAGEYKHARQHSAHRKSVTNTWAHSHCRQGALFRPTVSGPHQCSADTGADTWQKQALLPHKDVGLGAPQMIIRCHDGHFKALSRCRLVGCSVRRGENFLPTSRLQLSQRHPPMRSRKRLDQNYSQISEEVQVFFSFFETIFLTISFSVYHGDQTISRTSCRICQRSPGGESAGGWWSTSKSTCVVPAWTLTSENASFGVCESQRSHQLTSDPKKCFFGNACVVSESSFGA